MFSFFKTPTGIWTVIFTLCGLIFAVFFWLNPFSAEKRGLELSVTQNVELTPTPTLNTRGSLEFVYNGQKVPNLISTKLRFVNTGNQPIEEQHFIHGVNIVFPTDTRIIDFRLTEIQPVRSSSLFQQKFVKKVSDQEIDFTPALLNSGDIFDIDVLTTRSGFVDSQELTYKPADLQLDYQIYGISQIDLVAKIATNLDKQTEARKNINSLAPLALILPIAVLLTLLSKILPKRVINNKPLEPNELERQQFRNKITGIIFYGMLAIGLVYLAGIEIHDAWFLKATVSLPGNPS